MKRYVIAFFCFLLVSCNTIVYNRSVVKNVDQKSEMLGSISNTESEGNDSVEADKKNDVDTNIKTNKKANQDKENKQ